MIPTPEATVPAPAMDETFEVAQREVVFTLPLVLPSLNVRQRTHWSELHRQQKTLSQQVMAALRGPRHYPRPPLDTVRITVVRHSAGQLDADNLSASCKPLLDVLCANSPVHPWGLGIIADDAPGRCELIVRQQRAKRADAMTIVRVEEIASVQR